MYCATCFMVMFHLDITWDIRTWITWMLFATHISISIYIFIYILTNQIVLVPCTIMIHIEDDWLQSSFFVRMWRKFCTFCILALERNIYCNWFMDCPIDSRLTPDMVRLKPIIQSVTGNNCISCVLLVFNEVGADFDVRGGNSGWGV